MNLEINTHGTESNSWVGIQKSHSQPYNFNLKEHISDCKDGERIYIRSNFQTSQGKRKQWTASIPSNETVAINHSNFASNQEVKLIYFCNCNLSALYPKIVRHHLRDLHKCEMDKYDNFSVIFVICGTPKDAKRIKRIAKKLLPGLFSAQGSSPRTRQDQFEIRLHENTNYEHQGIRALWSEALTSNDEDILFYAHSKSLSKINRTKEVSHDSKACSEIILRNSDIIISLLNTFESVEKVGISQAIGRKGEWGWMWHNFYAAKAKYLKNRPKPLLSDDRFYYESWLAGRKNFEKNHLAPDKNAGISMLTDHGISIGHLARVPEITQLINNYRLHGSNS